MARNDADTAVLITRTRWSEVPRLRHQIARALAPQWRVLFVETPVAWRKWYDTEIEEVEPRIFRVRPTNRWNLPARVKTHVRRADAILQHLLMDELALALDRLGASSRPPVLLNFNHTADRLMTSDMFRLAVYVCNDDWIAKAPDRWSRPAVRRVEATVAESADLCLAVSYPLRDRLQQINSNTRLFLPGHEFVVLDDPPVAHRSDNGRIRALFVGELNRRVNYDWVEAAAKEPDIEINLIGPVKIPPGLVAALSAAGVRFHDPKFDEELHAFMRAMDVFVIPYHVRAGVVAATVPNKLFKCVAAGRPIVISAMPHFIDLGPGIIYRARTAQEFSGQIRAAAAEDGDELRRRRHEIALENTWERRGAELHAMIDAELQRKHGRDGASGRGLSRGSLSPE